MNLKMGIGHS